MVFFQRSPQNFGGVFAYAMHRVRRHYQKSSGPVHLVNTSSEMSNPLITDDKAILSVLLYQFLHGKSAYSSFKQFNEVVKDNFIDLNDFKFWFKRFKNGKFDERDDNFSISDFKSMLSDDKHCLRACIFFEYLKEIQMKSEFHHNDAFVVYKRMNEVIDINYPEFDFCFYRFLRGEFDLDFEYNCNQIRSFSDLPLETVRKILKQLQFSERCRIRKVSYNLRNIVDDTKNEIDKFSIRFAKSQISVYIHLSHYESHFIKYYQLGDTCAVKRGDERKKFKGKNYMDFASNDLSILLNASKFDSLVIRFGNNSKNFIYFKSILNSVNAKLHVKQLYLTGSTVNQFVKILPFLKPGTLEAIGLEHCIDQQYNQEAAMKKLLKMDQWRQAKILSWRGNGFPFPLEFLSHFRTIWNVQLPYRKFF
ncbi:hypothetical protein B9Z55_021134 [Caenorhabditis nigoni]|uniref:F-box domain-containing protein n=1 Tax=Caenorhabditis nigoni TaxID=1611254 RepID=A0A2G5TQM2_9PELO|nr:hypothetical protein B9Z55_021134 [Caenorhabditis nigoni]